MSYANLEDVRSAMGDGSTSEAAAHYLELADEMIDTLTFRRIAALGGLDALSEFQRDAVQRCCIRLAVWLADYADTLDSPLTGYSINGVSAQYGVSANMVRRNSVTLPRQLYALLEQTGLCCGVLR